MNFYLSELSLGALAMLSFDPIQVDARNVQKKELKARKPFARMT